MSKWFEILYNNDDGDMNWAYNILSSDLSCVYYIYDLLLQILDPCLFITNEIDEIQQLYNSPESIITQNVAIYHS